MSGILETLKFLGSSWLEVAVAVDKRLETQAARIVELEKDLEGAKEDRDELQAVFNQCLESDQRAIKTWQEAHPGKDLVWPDRTKVTVWLLEKGNAASARIAELEAALEDMAKHVWRGDWDKLKPETRALLDEKK